MTGGGCHTQCMALTRLVPRRGSVGGAVRRPMVWFAGASLLAMVALGFAATAILRRQARGEAIRDAKQITRLAGEGIAEPALTPELLAGDRAARARFGRVIRDRVVKDPVVRVKVWTLDGRVVYSDEPPLVGRRFDLEPEVKQAVRKRLVNADVSDLVGPRTATSAASGSCSRSTCRSRSQRPAAALRGLRPLRRDHRERARLLARFAPARAWRSWCSGSCSFRSHGRSRGACDSVSGSGRRSCGGPSTPRTIERRRIAQHLHDGVVQDLAGVSYSLRGGRDDRRGAPRPGERSATPGAADRDLPAEPPALRARAAVSDLLAPLSARGIAVERRHPGRPRAHSRDRGADLPRRAGGAPQRREARASHPRRGQRQPLERLASVLDGTATTDAGSTRAGRGGADDTSLGLRLLEDLVAERGGRLEVRSGAGARDARDAWSCRAVIRVLVVDDHPVLRAGLAQLLEQADGHRARRAGGRRDARPSSSRAPSGPTSCSWTSRCRAWTASRRRAGSARPSPDASVVVLTSFSDRERILDALDAGATGYLLKDAEPEELLRGHPRRRRGRGAAGAEGGQRAAGRAREARRTTSSHRASERCSRWSPRGCRTS